MGKDWKKRKNWKPKSRAKNKRRWNKKPIEMSGLVERALRRHGIARQVTSAMLVQKTNMLLDEVLDLHAKPDIRAAWYRNQELFIACRHPAATSAVQPLVEGIREELEAAFPSVEISRIVCRFHPQTFEER